MIRYICWGTPPLPIFIFIAFDDGGCIDEIM